jgi:competence protein ComEA
VALLLALGAADDLWRAAHPRSAPVPQGLERSPRVSRVSSGGAESVAEPLPAIENRASSSAEAPDSGVPKRINPAESLVVDLNRADARDLDRLPGIGPVLARRIIDYRARHGRIARCEELLAVPGIGPRLLERVRPHVVP